MAEIALAKRPTKMTPRQKGTGATSDSALSQSPNVESPLPSGYEPSHVIQLLVNMQGEIKSLCTKTDRLIKDVETLDGHVDKLNNAFNRAWGFGVAAVILIPLAATAIWWMVGGEITQMRDKINSLGTPVTQTQNGGQNGQH